MKFKKMMLVTLMLLAVLAIGAVSASEDIVSDDSLAVEDAQEDLIEESSVDEKMASDSQKEIVSANVDDFDVNISQEIDLGDEDAVIAKVSYPADVWGDIWVTVTNVNDEDDFDYDSEIIEYSKGNVTFYAESFSNLNLGNYKVKVTFDDYDDDNTITLKESILTVTKTITKDDFEIITHNYVEYSNDNVVNVWDYPATGVLSVYVDGNKRYSYTVTDTDDDVYVCANDVNIETDGKYLILVKFKVDGGDDIELAKYNLTAEFDGFEPGDDDYYGSIEEEVEVLYGDEFKEYLIVYFSSSDSDITGNLQVYVDGVVKYNKMISSSDYDEYGEIYLNILLTELGISKEGKYAIKITFDGEVLDEKTSTVVIIPKIVGPDSMAVGENELITITSTAGKNGNAKLYESDDEDTRTLIAEIPIVNGYGSYSLSKLSKGFHELYLDYTIGGYENYKWIYVHVESNTPGFSSTITPTTLVVGGNVNVKVTGPKTDSLLDIYVDGNKMKAVNFKDGVVNEVLSGLTVGSHRIKILLEGENFYSNTVTVTVNPAPAKKADVVKLTLKKVAVKKSAKKLVLQATLKINGKAVKGKVIKFKFNKKTYKAKTNKKGVAKVTVKKAVLKKLKKGKKITYTATYGKTTKKVTVKVKK